MSTLFLDLGNTRLKWATADTCGDWLAQGDAAHDQLDTAFAAWRAMPAPGTVHGACVAAPALREQLDTFATAHWGCKIDWLAPSRQALGVENRYRRLEQQGPDRWAAVLGARARFPGEALVIASAGTALTVDALTADGVFLGGMILPGYRLMKRALATGTARLPDAEGRVHDYPTSTEDAIETGIRTALAASIDAMVGRLQARGETPRLLLAGGDASQLAALLNTPATLVDNLVLHGLAALAFAQPATRPAP
ncbi:type III pantothenate kinase [Jeongeupia naejangsanensis]|uniref:Type III pantothenate kinase n=1 Tax=Jeongeupia naejangsanensis TaxID=613195 RepID=A0ABS2BNW2_9NEIS|nr:type III pantothenate kinase [Jeongeupia naejangsanensis]MBM3117316.1 type III pantothenate kinase [Jeongeupia naejangsanensis]